MRKHLLHILLAALLLTACHTPRQDARRLQRTLLDRQQKALALTAQLQESLAGNSFDSVWNLTQNAEPGILFYVFDRQGMVYWSDNWLAGSEVILRRYDQWYYHQFSNAHCVCRWTRALPYNILTVIPVKYAYPIQTKELHNTFIAPFRASDRLQVLPPSAAVPKGEPFAVKDGDGRTLFAVSRPDTVPEYRQENLAESFSYKEVLGGNTYRDSARKMRIYTFMEIVLFSLVFILGIVGLVRNHGFRNMRLATKFLYISVALLLFVSVYVFFVSTMHVRRRHERQQEETLQRKTLYLQKALQDLYFWNLSLSERNAEGMNIDLRDLSYTYETDIHVYDMQGNLVGSSAPLLFEKGLISRHIAPEPFFSKKADMLLHERIGDLEYLAAYTGFYNGNYVQIGYIAVPLFLSSEEVEAEAENFLAKLLPPYLIVLLLAFLINFFFSRGLTQPLSELSERMRHFRIGQPGNRISYDRNDEMGQLVTRYNEMVEELERSSEKLARSEREGAWRTMARQIAHEINNPLTPMKLTIQQLQRARRMGDEERFNEYFDKSTTLLIEQIDNLSRIAQSFSQFAKMPEVVTSEVDIAQRLFSVISLFRQNSGQVPIRYIGAQEGVCALADSEQIGQVFNNLIKNALQAIEGREGGDIIVMLKQDGQTVEVSVSDNGCGIPPDIQDKVFRPNFTTKNTGMGLGLAISKNIVEGSAGTITFETSPSGTTFFVRLRCPV
ncbi:MAG: HAMP domain-containing histidine kinase [Paludibacteraceae bacterium]|nr:HAMP domain-containing histidine kinase [Paludibacteraceae bacterium]